MAVMFSTKSYLGVCSGFVDVLNFLPQINREKEIV
jgi:hypothetical protein